MSVGWKIACRILRPLSEEQPLEILCVSDERQETPAERLEVLSIFERIAHGRKHLILHSPPARLLIPLERHFPMLLG